MDSRLNILPEIARPSRGASIAFLPERAGWPVVGAILLGLVISGAFAVAAAEFGLLLVVPAVLLVPVGLLLLRYPFAAVMLWLLIFPFVARGATGAGVPIYMALHLIMVPGTLWLTVLKQWAEGRKPNAVRFGLAEFVMLVSLLWTIGNILVFGQETIKVLLHFYDRLFVPYCMYWLVRLVAPTAEDLKRFLPVALFALASQLVIGVLMWFVPEVVPPQWISEAGERVTGTFRNPAVYTSTILFLALLILQYGMSSKRASARMFAMLLLGLTFFGVFISFSRGSWVGGVLVLLGLILVYPGTMIRFTAAGLALGLVLGTTVLQHEIMFSYQRLLTEETAQGRLLTGAKSVGMIDRKPLFGWGYGNYDLYDENFRVQIGAIVNENEKTSHNTFLTVAAEQGIPGLVLYLFPTGWWLLNSLAVWRRLPRRGFWSVSLLALLWLLILDHIAVSNFMDMIRFNYFGTTIYWMALALIATIVQSAPAPSHAPARVERPWLGQLPGI